MVREGAVKYALDIVKSPALKTKVIQSLNAWRRILFMSRLIGQDPQRYEGAAFGNVSQRMSVLLNGTQLRFAISGTPDMADAVRRLTQNATVRERRILCMGGQTDGVIALGRTADEAGCVMMATLASALAL